MQFSPLGNMNDFYRTTGWGEEIAHHVPRVIDQPVLKAIGAKYSRSPEQIALAWAVNSGTTMAKKSTIDWQIRENVEADFEWSEVDMNAIREMDLKARFNDPSFNYEYRLYSDLDGIEGAVRGQTH